MKDKSYHVQDGCANCNHCVINDAIRDDPPTYFCGLRPPKLFGSVHTLSRALNEKFWQWCEGREVQREGKCEFWDKEKA